MDNNWDLSKREMLFCKYYVAKGNRQEAIEQAGYSPRSGRTTACRLLKKQNIKDYIDYLTTKKVSPVEYSQDDIVHELLDISHLAKDSEEYHAAIRANELLGKHKGMFKEKVEHSGSVGIIFQGEADLKD